MEHLAVKPGIFSLSLRHLGNLTKTPSGSRTTVADLSTFGTTEWQPGLAQPSKLFRRLVRSIRRERGLASVLSLTKVYLTLPIPVARIDTRLIWLVVPSDAVMEGQEGRLRGRLCDD